MTQSIGYGACWGVLAALSLPLERPYAQVWKRQIFTGTGLAPSFRTLTQARGQHAGGKEKIVKNSGVLALRLWPGRTDWFGLKGEKHDNADAALLAEWLYRKERGDYAPRSKK